MNNIEIIKQFVAAWSRLDAEELAEFFTETGSYHNMPMNPIVGKDNIKAFIEGFIATWSKTDWEIVNIVAEGELVFCERVDKTQSSQGNVDLPCFGVFVMQNGKIHEWRDYFDLNTYMQAMA